MVKLSGAVTHSAEFNHTRIRVGLSAWEWDDDSAVFEPVVGAGSAEGGCV